MKETIKKEQVKVTLLYGCILLILGIVGMFFQGSLKFIITFCFIFGGTTVLSGFTYLGINRTKHKRMD